ncbi:winged helix DNA-binding domain-containing protein, partial [Clavulina sp. PMI_390]
PVTQLQVAVDPQQYWLLGQIEYYFSMQNLVNDMFLRQQMDSEGWVDIAMIASFKRMQNLTQDIALVHDTMLLSAFLEVTETRVRLSQRRWQDFVLPGAQQST